MASTRKTADDTEQDPNVNAPGADTYPDPEPQPNDNGVWRVDKDGKWTLQKKS